MASKLQWETIGGACMPAQCCNELFSALNVLNPDLISAVRQRGHFHSQGVIVTGMRAPITMCLLLCMQEALCQCKQLQYLSVRFTIDVDEVKDFSRTIHTLIRQAAICVEACFALCLPIPPLGI